MFNGQVTTHNSNSSNKSTRRILVVDDDSNHRYIFNRALSYAGYQVYPAATVAEADNLLAENHFDLLLCDVCLDDGRSGTDLVQAHVAELTKQGTCIVMVSSEGHYRHKCEALGLNIFVKKPVGVQPLMSLVDRLTA